MGRDRHREWEVPLRFRFVHAADLHLDSPLQILGARRKDLRERLVDATLDAFDAIVLKALDEGAAFVVFAGDLYDGITRGARAQLRFQAGLRRLSESGIEVFIAHGNHDPAGGRWNQIREWPRGVFVFPASTPQTFEVARDGVLLARVHGVSYGTQKESRNLAARFQGGPGELDLFRMADVPNVPPVIDVAVLHCNVGGDAEHESYSPCSLDDLVSRRIDYWALGHIHRHKVLAAGGPWVVYPGCSQGRSFSPGDQGEKGAVLVEVDAGRVVRVTPFPTDRVRFVEVTCELDGVADLGALQERLVGMARLESERHDGREVLMRARIRGRSDLHGEIRSLERREELLAELGREPAGLGVQWLELIDESGPALDLEALAAGEDLRAALIKMARSWQEGETGLGVELTRELKSVVGDVSGDELEAVIERSLYEVLERLGEGG